MRIVPYLIIFIISLALIPQVAHITASTQTGVINVIDKRPLIFNLTTYFSPLDPKFYSFEALQPPKPNVSPIVITVAKDAVFNNTGLVSYNATVYIPPGNYSLILLNVTINESGGPQYDRTIYIYANNITVFWGSTQELLNSTAWADLTLLENFLRGNVTFKIVLPNYYVPKYNITGVYKVTVKLVLYPGSPPPDLPNYVIPLFYNAQLSYPLATLTPSNPNATQTIVLPNGTYNAMLVLYLKGGGLDEFWYASLPAIRDVLIYYNGYLAGVVQPYPVVYTGGIDLFWWKPVTSINTLSFHTVQMIPLTPFLASGLKANLTVSIQNLMLSSQILQSTSMSWDVSGYVLVWNSSNPITSAKFLKAEGYYLDSGPIIVPQGNGYTYDEGSRFELNYLTLINFSKGYELVSYSLEGTTKAHQVGNPIYELAELNESSSIMMSITGSHDFSYSSYLGVQLSLPIAAFAAKVSPGSTPPINYTYMQNGTFSLITRFMSDFNVSKVTVSYLDLNENVSTRGGFGGLITVINSYGGAVMSELTQNYAYTVKQLSAKIAINGYSANEKVTLIGVQNSTVHLQGHYAKVSVSVSYNNSNDPLMQVLFYLIELIIRFFFTL